MNLYTAGVQMPVGRIRKGNNKTRIEYVLNTLKEGIEKRNIALEQCNDEYSELSDSKKELLRGTALRGLEDALYVLSRIPENSEIFERSERYVRK